jgi:hypothetical protein
MHRAPPPMNINMISFGREPPVLPKPETQIWRLKAYFVLLIFGHSIMLVERSSQAVDYG